MKILLALMLLCATVAGGLWLFSGDERESCASGWMYVSKDAAYDGRCVPMPEPADERPLRRPGDPARGEDPVLWYPVP